MNNFEDKINNYWKNRDNLDFSNNKIKQDVAKTLAEIDKGSIRVANKTIKNGWQVNQWIKKTILLSFRTNEMKLYYGSPYEKGGISSWYDKVPSKFTNWTEEQYKKAGFRSVPGSVVRYGSYIGKNVVLMPSFVNLGAYIDEGTMIDSWATVGSCAQIGKNCHISGGAGIGGVLEPLQADPVIVEDNCFIGARSEIVEGVKIGEGSVISMGVFIGQSTKIVHRDTGKIIYGEVPPYSVVVPGSLPNSDPTKPALYCAVIIKQVDEKN